MAAVLQGKMTLEEAAAQMKRATRQFVRRQANWFKESDARIRWFEVTPWIVPELENWICSQEGWVRSFS
jgi:tRNA dimethylallyltransferase